ncbi:MAG: NAD-dependent dehydratase, partial [Cyclobacteriaceae bacterium]|nr:NAD-dependent dehydratase [Cyclobacteriaceae bacterium]
MKKYLITGSLGNISKPVVEGLVKQGNIVSVITGSQDRVADIEKLGAKALVGNLFDATFVERAFQDIDVAYTMIPPIWQTANWR